MAVEKVLALSDEKGLPGIVFLITHPWEFIEFKNPYVTTGKKKIEILEEVFTYLRSLKNVHFIPAGQMLKIYESNFLPGNYLCP